MRCVGLSVSTYSFFLSVQYDHLLPWLDCFPYDNGSKRFMQQSEQANHPFIILRGHFERKLTRRNVKFLSFADTDTNICRRSCRFQSLTYNTDILDRNLRPAEKIPKVFWWRSIGAFVAVLPPSNGVRLLYSSSRRTTCGLQGYVQCVLPSIFFCSMKRTW